MNPCLPVTRVLRKFFAIGISAKFEHLEQAKNLSQSPKPLGARLLPHTIDTDNL